MDEQEPTNPLPPVAQKSDKTSAHCPNCDKCTNCIRKGIPCHPFPEQWIHLLREVQAAATAKVNASPDATPAQLEALQRKLDALQADLTDMLELPADVSSAVAMIRGKGPALPKIQVQYVALMCKNIEGVKKILSLKEDALCETVRQGADVYKEALDIMRHGTIDSLGKEFFLQDTKDGYKAINDGVLQAMEEMRGSIDNLGNELLTKELLRVMGPIHEVAKEFVLLEMKHLLEKINDSAKSVLQENELTYKLLNGCVERRTPTAST